MTGEEINALYESQLAQFAEYVIQIERLRFEPVPVQERVKYYRKLLNLLDHLHKDSGDQFTTRDCRLLAMIMGDHNNIGLRHPG